MGFFIFLVIGSLEQCNDLLFGGLVRIVKPQASFIALSAKTGKCSTFTSLNAFRFLGMPTLFFKYLMAFSTFLTARSCLPRHP